MKVTRVECKQKEVQTYLNEACCTFISLFRDFSAGIFYHVNLLVRRRFINLGLMSHFCPASAVCSAMPTFNSVQQITNSLKICKFSSKALRRFFNFSFLDFTITNS